MKVDEWHFFDFTFKVKIPPPRRAPIPINTASERPKALANPTLICGLGTKLDGRTFSFSFFDFITSS